MRRLVLLLAVVLILAPAAVADPPKRLLLLGQGPDGHPPQTHEYAAGLKVLAKCLRAVEGLDVTTARADEPWREGPELIGRSDGVVLYLSEGARWLKHDPKRQEALARLAARGGGLAVLHWGMGTKEAAPIEPFVKLFGGCHGGPDRKFAIVEVEASPAEKPHPALAGVGRFKVRDEFYYRLKFAKADDGLRPLLRVPIEGQDETVAWAWERPDGGRSFGFSGLHFHENWRLTEYRRLVTQGVLWSLKLPVPEGGLRVEVTEEDLKLK